MKFLFFQKNNFLKCIFLDLHEQSSRVEQKERNIHEKLLKMEMLKRQLQQGRSELEKQKSKPTFYFYIWGYVVFAYYKVVKLKKR